MKLSRTSPPTPNSAPQTASQPEHAYLLVRVKAGARKERIQQVGERVYTIEVREKAECGLANARVKALLSHLLGLKPNQVRMVKGATAPKKVFLLTNENHHENKL